VKCVSAPGEQKEMRFGARVAVKADRLVRHARYGSRRAKSGKKSEGKAHDFLAHSREMKVPRARTSARLLRACYESSSVRKREIRQLCELKLPIAVTRAPISRDRAILSRGAAPLLGTNTYVHCDS
jgi:hypothetical protein